MGRKKRAAVMFKSKRREALRTQASSCCELGRSGGVELRVVSARVTG